VESTAFGQIAIVDFPRISIMFVAFPPGIFEGRDLIRRQPRCDASPERIERSAMRGLELWIPAEETARQAIDQYLSHEALLDHERIPLQGRVQFDKPLGQLSFFRNSHGLPAQHLAGNRRSPNQFEYP